MMQFLTWLEEWPLSVWVRESGALLAYPTILFLHTIGLAVVVGLSAAISLRALGVAPSIPCAPLQAYFRILWWGFWVNAAAGALLLVADATTTLTNPVFHIKMVLVFAAMCATIRLRGSLRRAAAAPDAQVNMRTWGCLCLLLWVGAVTAGRLMAYVGVVSGAPGLRNSL
ncbi:MAG: hypothetical protein ABL961_04305 [Vicinamibacterales bacterium]